VDVGMFTNTFTLWNSYSHSYKDTNTFSNSLTLCHYVANRNTDTYIFTFWNIYRHSYKHLYVYTV
jgi:hypothetical protein